MTKLRQDLRARAFQLSATVLRLFPRIVVSTGTAFIARQLLRSVTAIGAQLEEGAAASSRRDMAAKYAIALREACEANYRARLPATDPQMTDLMAPVTQETHEFIAMLTVSVRKLRQPAQSTDLEPPSEPLTSDL